MARLTSEKVKYLAKAICDAPFDGPYIYTWYIDNVLVKNTSPEDFLIHAYEAPGAYVVKCVCQNQSLWDTAEGQVTTTVIDKPDLGWMAPAMFKTAAGDVLVLERYPYKKNYVSGPEFEDWCNFVKIAPDGTITYMNPMSNFRQGVFGSTGMPMQLTQSPYWGAALTEDGNFIVAAHRYNDTLYIGSMDLRDGAERWIYKTIDLTKHFLDPSAAVNPAAVGVSQAHKWVVVLPSGGSNVVIGPMYDCGEVAINPELPVTTAYGIIPWRPDPQAPDMKIWSLKHCGKLHTSEDTSIYTEDWKKHVIDAELVMYPNHVLADCTVTGLLASGISYSGETQLYNRINAAIPIQPGSLITKLKDTRIACYQGTPKVAWEYDLESDLATKNGVFYFKTSGDVTAFRPGSTEESLTSYLVVGSDATKVVFAPLFAKANYPYHIGAVKHFSVNPWYAIRGVTIIGPYAQYHTSPLGPVGGYLSDPSIIKYIGPPCEAEVIAAHREFLLVKVEGTISTSFDGMGLIDGVGSVFVPCKYNNEGISWRHVDHANQKNLGNIRPFDSMVNPESAASLPYGVFAGYPQNAYGEGIYLAPDWWDTWPGCPTPLFEYDNGTITYQRYWVWGSLYNMQEIWPPSAYTVNHAEPYGLTNCYGSYYGSGDSLVSAYVEEAVMANEFLVEHKKHPPGEAEIVYWSTNMSECGFIAPVTYSSDGPEKFRPDTFSLDFNPYGAPGTVTFSGALDSFLTPASKQLKMVMNGLKPWLIRYADDESGDFDFANPWNKGADWAAASAAPTKRHPRLSIGLADDKILFCSGYWQRVWETYHYVNHFTPRSSFEIWKPSDNTWTSVSV